MTAKALASALRGYAQQAWDAVPAQDDVLRGFGPPEDVAEIVKAFIPQPQNILPGLQSLGQGMQSGDLNKMVGGGALALGGAIDMVPGGRAVKSGAMALGKALGRGPIRGYHGSPYNFDFFDSSKIGTGEGAQAYGRGHYIAEAEGLARSYRDGLTQNSVIGPGGKKITPSWDDPAYNAVQYFNRANGDVGAAIKILRSELKYPTDWTRDIEAVLDGYRVSGMKSAPPGHMYEVNIHSDPNKFLDWDKPLWKQNDEIKSAVKAMGIPEEYMRGVAGGQFYHELPLVVDAGKAVGDTRKLPYSIIASDTLRKEGIPGIRYLDGGSRAAGKGSSNYVVFDPKTIEIIRKYGIAGLLGGAGAAASQGADNAGGGI